MIYDISPVNNYDGNGITTRFDFNFYVETADELKVYLISQSGERTLLVNNLDYTINELRNIQGSYITYPIEGSSYSILSENEKISLQLALPISQETQYNNSSLLNLSALEYSFDYLTRLIQIISRKIELCVKAEEGSSAEPGKIIEEVVSIGSAVIQKANEFNEIIERLDELYVIASEKYDSIIDISEEISGAAETISHLETDKANKSGDNFDSSIKAIDGQWYMPGLTPVELSLPNTQSSIDNGYEFDISSFLPSDNYNYEVMLDVFAFSLSTTATDVYMSLPFLNNREILVLSVISQSRCPHNIFSVPVDLTRKIKLRASNTGWDYIKMQLIARKRIGTNT